MKRCQKRAQNVHIQLIKAFRQFVECYHIRGKYECELVEIFGSFTRPRASLTHFPVLGVWETSNSIIVSMVIGNISLLTNKHVLMSGRTEIIEIAHSHLSYISRFTIHSQLVLMKWHIVDTLQVTFLKYTLHIESYVQYALHNDVYHSTVRY